MKVIGVLEKDSIGIYIKAVEQACRALGERAEYVPIFWGSEDSDEMLEMMLELEKRGGNAYDTPEGCLDNSDAEIAVGQFAPFGSKFMEDMPEIRMIGLLRAGLENVDIEEANKRGIAVVNASGRNADAVSDFTIGLMLAECRSIARCHHDIMQGKWIEHYPNYDNMPDLRGKTVGLFGFGYIGRLMAEKLSGFHVNIYVYDPYISEETAKKHHVKKVEKAELFETADFICVHARYTEETYHAIGKAEIDAMKPTAYFINSARAGLVDYDALTKALKEHRIAGAALDVYYEEPLHADSPFLKMDNVTLTPHTAGVTYDALINSAKILGENIAHILDGEPKAGFVNPEVLENPVFREWIEKAADRIGRKDTGIQDV